MTGDKKQISIKKILTNPTLIAVALGVIVFVIAKKPLVDLCVEGSTGDTFITKIMSSVGMISDMVTPLSMFVIGLRLSAVKLKALLLDKQAYFVTLNKLVVMPIIVMASVLFLPVANEIKFTVFLLLSMPSASSTVLFAVKFNEDSDFASLVVLQSTLLAIVAIPLMFLVFNAFIGVV
jgi:predicted permease